MTEDEKKEPQAEETAGETKEEPVQAAEPEQEAPAEAEPAEESEEKEAKPSLKDRFARKNKEAEALKAKLEAGEKAAAELKDKLLRTAAEYDNFRKRSAREQEASFNNGLSFAVEKLIPIIDTLEMAAAAPCSDENYKKGVEMTLVKAASALEALKIEVIECEGKPFDPNLMAAVQQVPAQEGQESGTVVQVFQKGYSIAGKVIRHAAVVVAE